MASLIENMPLDGLLPVTGGGVTLTARVPRPVTSVMPFDGTGASLAPALKKLGLAFPVAGQSVGAGAVWCLWTGRNQAFLVGADPAGLEGKAALTDQSDGWAVMRLEGADAVAVLARLVPLDLRAAVFGVGAVARSGLNHMMMILHRVTEDCFDIWVFRSMAATAVHEVTQAMETVAARR